MKNFRVLLGAYLLGGIGFISTGLAQTATSNSDELYQKYRAADGRFGFAVGQNLKNRGTEENKECGSFVSFDSCPPHVEMLRLKHELKRRADSGDAEAMFYTGLLHFESAELFSRASSSRTAANEFASAINYYKRAGDGGEIGGYWNVALMYSNGTGVTQSKSAAIEWYYKAGAGYLSIGQREKALAALDMIKALDKDHRLGSRLQGALNKGEPK